MDVQDHKAIGGRLELFHQQEEGPGVVFWHPRGAALWRALEDYIRRKMRRAGYAEVITPQLLSAKLWEKSGHLEKFGANMFQLADGERAFALKPMSCPGHIQIFGKRLRSHRELPLRLCEFGACHRNEPSGALNGLMRTRAFTQDDAHIFCRDDQVEAEVARFCGLLREVYRDCGFADFAVAFSTRPALRAGADADWERAEAQLAAAARAAGLEPKLQPGEGAFYGPKLEFSLRDRAGRDWQCGTVQLDFVLPERLGAEYVDEASRRVRPVMLHHAVFGSLERFIAILLEHHQGALPFWLAPEQVVVAPVAEAQAEAARAAAEAFERADLRVALDARAETLSRRRAEARARGVPIFAVLGAREAEAGSVALSRREGEPVVSPVAEAAARLAAEARP